MPHGVLVRTFHGFMHRSLVVLLSWAGSLVLFPLLTLGCAGTSPDADRPAGLNFYVQAVEAYNRGDNDRAVVLLLEAVRQNSELRMARSLLGDLYRARGDYKSALPNYEKLAKLEFQGFTSMVRTVGDKVFEVRQVTPGHPRFWATVTIQHCLDCVPMELPKWKAKEEELKVLLGPLKGLPNVKFEVGQRCRSRRPLR